MLRLQRFDSSWQNKKKEEDMSKLGCVYEGDFFYFLPMVNHH